MTTQALRSALIVVGVGALSLFAHSAYALDDEAAKTMLKKYECTKCHAIDKDKKGPSYQKIAKDNKGKADAEAKVTKSITTGPKVKLSDGTEEEHKKIEAKDPAQVKGLVQWILAQ